jgi:hypothetical protein
MEDLKTEKKLTLILDDLREELTDLLLPRLTKLIYREPTEVCDACFDVDEYITILCKRGKLKNCQGCKKTLCAKHYIPAIREERSKLLCGDCRYYYDKEKCLEKYTKCELCLEWISNDDEWSSIKNHYHECAKCEKRICSQIKGRWLKIAPAKDYSFGRICETCILLPGEEYVREKREDDSDDGKEES